MLQRSIYSKLLEWKNSNNKKILLVDGARQIGKTYIIEAFAKREYSSYIKIDFLTDKQSAVTLSQAKSTREVIEALSLLAGKKVSPKETLIFFDEIQAAQNLVTFSKYLVQDGRFDIIMSGSMLGVELSHARSLPVGYIHEEVMYPLDIFEFFEALGVPKTIIQSIETCYEQKIPVGTGVHEQLTRLIRLYLVIGGMPEAVQSYIDNNYDLGSVRAIQEDLVRFYREDIAKYAQDRALQIKAIYGSIPSQLNKENKRFLLKTLNVDAKFERYANDFAWLIGARAALKTTCITEPKTMLKRTEEQNRFKLYLSDTGMLVSCYDTDVALAALSGEKSVNFGGIYENLVAQELASANVPLHYYHHTRNGEVDFIQEQMGEVFPIEVKSGKDFKRHIALNNLMSNSEYNITKAYVFSESNVLIEQRKSGIIYYLPFYMLPFIAKELAKKSLNGIFAAPPIWS